MTRLLALDIGTTTGWAMNSGAEYRWGHFDLKPGPMDSHGMRYVSLKRELACLFTAGVDLVVYETNAFTRGKAATTMMAGYVATLQAFCLELPEPVEYKGVPVVEIKFHATGRGNASKSQMVWSATLAVSGNPRLPSQREKVTLTANVDLTEDEADAICLLDYAREVWG